MKKADETPSSEKSNSANKRVSKKIFKNFAEYWHLTKNLPESHRKLLVSTLSKTEQKALKSSYDKGGWEDLFMRNACDETLDEIKKRTGVDLVDLRVKVLSGRPHFMHKTFWTYINNCFERVPWEHISYIFDGVTIEGTESESDSEYVKLIKFVF